MSTGSSNKDYQNASNNCTSPEEGQGHQWGATEARNGEKGEETVGAQGKDAEDVVNSSMSGVARSMDNTQANVPEGQIVEV